jgi:hypothetical protein
MANLVLTKETFSPDNELKPTIPMEMERDIKSNIASDNLNNNKVNTTIDPDTVGNNVNIKLYLCSIYIKCCLKDK